MNHRPLEKLSKRQREATPIPFALYLLAGVWQRFPCSRVAVLFTQERSNYLRLSPWVDVWDAKRDARCYSGVNPIIAHPPCGPWGKYRYRCKQDASLGILAMNLVHQWGGVVEQPLGSRLFALHGMFGQIQKIRQCDYGHESIKDTLLYWYVPGGVSNRE